MIDTSQKLKYEIHIIKILIKWEVNKLNTIAIFELKYPVYIKKEFCDGYNILVSLS